MTRTAVIGLGVIGGSVALALSRRGEPVAAWAADAGDREAARRAGISVLETATDATRDAEIVLLAVPLDAIGPAARAIHADAPDALLLHAGSLQSQGVLGLSRHDRDTLLGTHPMAGSHASGFAAARAEMFEGATVYVESRASEAQRSAVEALWRAAGAARFDYRPAEEHDRLMAWVSHLPQIAASALAATLADRGVPLELCGPGARDMTRLAASSFAMWRPIIDRAPPETFEALWQMIEALSTAARSLGEPDRFAAAWEMGRRWRTGGVAHGADQ